MKRAAATVEARTKATAATAATALVTIALVTLAIAHFVACHNFDNAITCVVAIAIAFVGMQQRG